MIEPRIDTAVPSLPSADISPARKVLRMGHSERMAGSIPIWETPHDQQQRVEQLLTAATTGGMNTSESFEAALAYQNAQIEPAAGEDPPQEFGFGDLVDMVNPLQHIPIVGHIYREATGDDIKPISQILGGAVFGGPLGAAGGLVNVIIREETGKDITGNALALAMNGERPEFKPDQPAPLVVSDAQAPLNQTPEARLSAASTKIESAAYRDLPPALLGFADFQSALPAQDSPTLKKEKQWEEWHRRQKYND